MTAPSSAGHYFSYWKLRNASGAIFGIGSTANRAFWAEINVDSSAGVGYDLPPMLLQLPGRAAPAYYPSPVRMAMPKASALKKDKPKFESGS